MAGGEGGGGVLTPLKVLGKAVLGIDVAKHILVEAVRPLENEVAVGSRIERIKEGWEVGLLAAEDADADLEVTRPE